MSAFFFVQCTEDPGPDGPDGGDNPIDPGEDDGEVTTIPSTCNGEEALCARPFDEVVFPATHNSMSAKELGYIGPNQEYGIARQLEDGIRAFLFDVHVGIDENTSEETLMLCHSVCLLGSRPLADMLAEMAEFMKKNRGEVVTLIIEDHADAAEISQALIDAGLDKWAYTYDGGAWPTLRQLIDDNTRLIVSAENQGVAPGESQDGLPPWYFNAWKIMFDNPYTYETVDAFSCDLNRGSESSSLYLLNHWLGTPLPRRDLADEANTYDVLYEHAKDCADAHGRVPNFIAVDHYDIGDLFDVVHALNGLAE